MADLNSTIVRGNLRVTEEIIGPLNVTNLSTGANGQFLSISNNVPTWVNNPNTWRPLGTGENDAAAGNHSHDGRYLLLGGGTLTGALNFNNSTWNLVGDDVYIGDYDQAGSLGIKGKNGQTNIGFVNQSNDYYIKLASPGVTANRTITMPDDTGTIALTKNIPTSLPANGGNADTVDGKHSSDFCLSNSNITNLPINGGIYWNSYVESSSDGSDAASITVIKDGNGTNGTVLQIKQANDNNDIVNVVAGDLRLNGTSVSIYGHDHDNRYYTESEINTKLNGKSDTSHTHTNLKSNTDNRNSNTIPNDYNGVLNIAGLKDNSKIEIDTNTYGTYSCLIGVRGWQDSSGGDSHEIALTGNGQILHRSGSTTSWGGWDKIAHTSYIDTYFPRAKYGNDSYYSDVSNSFIGGVAAGPRTSEWEFLYRAEHRNGAGDGPNYVMEMVSNLTSDSSIYWRKKTGGSFTSFREIIDSNNIGSQNVNYANSAGSVAWGNVTGKPSTYPPDSHTHNYLPVNQYGGVSVSGVLDLSSSSNGIKFSNATYYVTNIEAGSVDVNIGTASAGYTTYVTATFQRYDKGSGSWYVVATVRGDSPAQPECVVAGIGDVNSNGIKIRVRKIANNSSTGNPTWKINWIAIKYY